MYSQEKYTGRWKKRDQTGRAAWSAKFVRKSRAQIVCDGQTKHITLQSVLFCGRKPQVRVSSTRRNGRTEPF